MRKKLESKKVIKETDKLAIEPKSLADFKVPEIPLKRIQDIYKSSDLLRSRSESDLLTRNQLDLLKIAIPVTYDDKCERDNLKRITKFADKNTNSIELKDTTENHSIQTIFDEYTSETYDNFRMASISSASNGTHSEKYVSSMEKQIDISTIETKQKNASNDAQTNLSTIRSELQTVSDTIFEDYNAINTEPTENKSINDQSQPKTLIKQFEVQEIGDIDCSSSTSIPSKSDYPTENAHISTVTDSNILTYSKKLDFLQLNNKNLSEDISSIENDIKALSEIMSRLSNESNEKSKVNKNEISTSQNISEIISKTIFSDKIADIADEEKQTISSGREINMESLSISTNDKRSRSLNESSRDKYTSERKNNEISIIISEEVPILSNSTHEIDYEAKSKEIMNQIEKSIISEHITIADDDYNAISLENENEKLLSGNVSELDIKSISEILSKVSESKKSFDFAMNSATDIIDDSKKDDSSKQSEIFNKTSLEENFMEDQTSETHLSKISEYSHIKSMHSPIIAGHRSKESYETNSQDDLQGTRNISSTEVSHVISENLKSSRYRPEVLEIETSIVDHSKISDDLKSKKIQTANIVDSTIIASNVDQNHWHMISAGNISQDKDDWTTSDSFEIPQDEISTGKQYTKLENTRSHLVHMDTLHDTLGKNMLHIDDTLNQEVEINSAGIIDVSAFIPEEESINVNVTFNNVSESNVIKSNNELDDILDIIARENQETKISNNERENIDDVISDSMAELLDKVENILQNKEGADNYLKEISCDNDIYINDNRIEFISNASMLNNKTQNEMNLKVMDKSSIVSVNTNNEFNNSEKIIDISSQAIDENKLMNVSLCAKIDNEKDSHEIISEIREEIIITELDSNSTDHALSELEVDTKVELIEEEECASNDVNRSKDYYAAKENKVAPIEIKEYLEPILEQDSSDGEQLDNLVEVVESGLDIVEKLVTTSQNSPESIINNMISIEIEEAKKETANDKAKRNSEIAVTDIETTYDINKTFDLVKDPEYEDISEESLEVSEILDKHDNLRADIAKKSVNLPDTYRITQKSEEVLRILDEISQKSTSDSISNSQKKDTLSAQSITEEISELLGAEVSTEDIGLSQSNRLMKDKAEEESYESRTRFLEKVEVQKRSIELDDNVDLSKEKNTIPLQSDQRGAENKSSRVIYELHERVSLQEQDGSSESSEAGDTPRGVSEIEMDSPRDFNDSRLDIDVLDDDLLSGTKTIGQDTDVKANFHSTSIVATSEKDIEAMIDKLKGIFTILLLY